MENCNVAISESTLNFDIETTELVGFIVGSGNTSEFTIVDNSQTVFKIDDNHDLSISVNSSDLLGFVVENDQDFSFSVTDTTFIRYISEDLEDTLVAFSKNIDFVNDNIIYKGEADPGTVNSASKWRIKKTEFVGTDDDVVVTWASGNAYFDKVWDNRLTYTYL